MRKVEIARAADVTRAQAKVAAVIAQKSCDSLSTHSLPLFFVFFVFVFFCAFLFFEKYP